MAGLGEVPRHRFAETRGWGRNIGFAVNRGLSIALTGYVEGDVIRHSEIFAPLRALDIPVGHTVTVLQEMGIFLDDSTPSFESWLTERLEGLAPGIRAEAERWTRTLRDGGPRSAPRQPGLGQRTTLRVDGCLCLRDGERLFGSAERGPQVGDDSAQTREVGREIGRVFYSMSECSPPPERTTMDTPAPPRPTPATWSPSQTGPCAR
ncbi:hypothetical protein ABT246_35020 [Streptomyces sp. NPDC001553]|uniref:hypothetical protein n=1 Tax=Streptomyces sp. NPDC001553 TaxID=3154385 RepID=UPI003320250D